MQPGNLGRRPMPCKGIAWRSGAVALYQKGEWISAVAYIVASVALALLGLTGGLLLIRWLT